MNDKVKEHIKRYAKLRGRNNEAINIESLTQAYLAGTPAQKKEYVREMESYFDAIREKRILAGQSILHTVYVEEEKEQEGES